MRPIEPSVLRFAKLIRHTLYRRLFFFCFWTFRSVAFENYVGVGIDVVSMRFLTGRVNVEVDWTIEKLFFNRWEIIHGWMCTLFMNMHCSVIIYGLQNFVVECANIIKKIHEGKSTINNKYFGSYKNWNDIFNEQWSDEIWIKILAVFDNDAIFI